MTIDEAIQAIKNELLCVSRQTDEGCDRECGKCDLALSDDVILSAYDMAIDALRAQQEAEKIEPLTESEIDSIKEAPLYVVPLEKEDALPGWCIYKSKNGLAVFRLKNHFNGMYFPARKDYGKKWLAYRHPPKEAHDGADT